MPTVAINGLGRIGRATPKILHDVEDVDVAAVNDIASAENLAYLLRYDTVYGRYGPSVRVDHDQLLLDGKGIRVCSEPDPAALPWEQLGVELVFECTGAFRHHDEVARHLQAGARFVILSAPARSEAIATVVPGAHRAPADRQVISCASCTTNCITPVMEIMQRRLGVERAVMTTVHAYTATQHLVDGPSRDFRRGRAGAANLVPASTGAARATTQALPELAGRFDGVAIRVPVPVVSIADIVLVASHAIDTNAVNALLCEEAATDRYQGILGVADDPVVSADLIGDPRASVVDAAMTRVVDGTLVKILSWYDNEWGFSNQMVREALSMLGVPATG